MKHLFLDTNVLIDFFANRKPFSDQAALLFNYALKKNIVIYVSAVSYNNIYYILRQTYSHTDTIKMLSELNAWTEIIDVSKAVIKEALQSDFKDFEDAIQYNCAKAVDKIELIVTRDTKDFRKSSLPIMTPQEAVALVENTNK